MTITSTTQVAGPVDVDFQVELLRNAKALCPYFAGTMAASVALHGGTFTAKWRRIENLTPVTTALSELTGSVNFPTRTGVTPTVTDPTATVQKYGNFMFLSEEVDLVNYNGQGEKFMEILGINAGQSLNRLQRNEMEDNFTAIFSGSATTATGLTGAASASGFIKGSDMDATHNALMRNEALKFRPMTTGSQNVGSSPVRSSYWGIAHTDVIEGMRALTGFLEVQTYAGQTEIAEGEAGYFRGVRWIETSEGSIDVTTGVAATGSSTTFGRSTATRYDVYSSVVYGKDAVGSLGFGKKHLKEIYMAGDDLPAVMVIKNERGSAGSADPLHEISTIGWKSWHAAKVLNGNWGRVIKSTAPILDSNE
jgi:N4-gp56 family major capsid protein